MSVKSDQITMENLYEVEKIVAHRRDRNGEYEYFVKWKQYPDSENTWEPDANFPYKEILDKYFEKRKRDQANGTKNRGPLERSRDDRSHAKNKTMKRKKIVDMTEKRITQILGIITRSDQKVAFVRVDASSHIHMVEHEALKRNHPKMVLEFYEKCLNWKKLTFLTA